MSGQSHDSSGEAASRNSPPMLPPESPGSSVSSRMQEEYSELLKYAVGMPPLDLKGLGNPEKESVFQPINSNRSGGSNRSGVSSSRQTPVHHQQGETVNDANTNSIYPTHFTSKDESTDSEHSFHFFTETDKNDNKIKKKTGHSKTSKHKHGAIVGTAVLDMSCKLDGWLAKLKTEILEEMGKSTTQAADCVTKLHYRERQELMEEKERLCREVTKLGELVSTCEQSMCRKDTLIENLTQALAKEKEKVTKAQAFFACKAQVVDSKREKFTERVAQNFHNHMLMQKVFKAWFGTVQCRWRKRVERLCEVKAQSICTQLSTDYECKIQSLNSHVAELEEKMRILQCEREQYSQQVKKAFMRGVCALNMEAMSAFGAEDSQDASYSNNNVNINNNLESSIPQKDEQSSKSLPPDLTVTAVPDLYNTGFQPHSMPATSSSGNNQKVKTTKSRPSTAPNSRTGTKSLGIQNQGVTLAPPMASIVVERHDPITKQTVGKATAVRFPKSSAKEENTRKQTSGLTSVPKSQQSTFGLQFKPLAGQSSLTMSPSIKVVE